MASKDEHYQTASTRISPGLAKSSLTSTANSIHALVGVHRRRVDAVLSSLDAVFLQFQ